MIGRLLAGLRVRRADPATPRLLGEGLDDIVQRTPRALKPAERLLRYVRARAHVAERNPPAGAEERRPARSVPPRRTY